MQPVSCVSLICSGYECKAASFYGSTVPRALFREGSLHWGVIFSNTVNLGFYELSHFMNKFEIPLRFPISPYRQNIGFYEPRFL